MRESEGMCVSSEPVSIPKLVVALNSALASLAISGSEALWTETHGTKGFIWSHLKVIWIYELDFSSTILDYLLLSQHRPTMMKHSLIQTRSSDGNYLNKVRSESQAKAK